MVSEHELPTHHLVTGIKAQIENNLKKFINTVDRFYSLSTISPLLFKNIEDFVLRDGKRIRPTLFITGYLGYSPKVASHLYTCALSFELLHDFTLIHDDIIDKSDKRRGKPSVHTMLNNYLMRFKNIKCNGQDLAIVIGDILYAIAIHAFLSIQEDTERKEKALKKFIETTIYTGTGEFSELLSGTKDIEKFTKGDIYRIYDFKTAYYSFASPLIIGAILAGAQDEELIKLSQYGLFIGRAFQIQDDIIGMFASERDIGKSILSDLQEAKKTILVWYAYHHSNVRVRRTIQAVFSKRKIRYTDLVNMRTILTESHAIEFAKKEIETLISKAQRISDSLTMKKRYKDLLSFYVGQLLQISR